MSQGQGISIVKADGNYDWFSIEFLDKMTFYSDWIIITLKDGRTVHFNKRFVLKIEDTRRVEN